MSLLGKLFGDANRRTVGRYADIVAKINELEPTFEHFSPDELKAKTEEFRKRLADGDALDDLIPEAFAAVRESAKRTLKQRHYDVQLMGGLALHSGNIAEMKTGEGKTLVATLPAYLNALSGHGVHVVTVNDYLARRDATWMGQIFYALGLSTAAITHEASYQYDPAHVNPEQDQERDITGGFRIVHEYLRPVQRRQAYEADITYGTNNEYGFDYLRDNMAYSLDQMVQAKGHHYAIVDEIDSILIDEARTPLIISAPDEDSGKLYQTFSKIVPSLKAGEDYTVDEKLKAVSITEAGIEKVEAMLKIKNIYEEGGARYVHHLQQALKALVLFHRDKEYVVREGEVIIVDEFTGRMMPGRRWSEGLHQAVEAKEGVLVQKESRTLATITFQNYFRLYKKLSGMTGTAQTSAEEFHKVYKLDVISIPTNKPMMRENLTDRIYKTEEGKFRAIVQEVKARHEAGQPVLIGTVSIAKNEMLAAMLEREGIRYDVLNAKNHEREAEILAQAGRHAAVTVATNMAGRGVDIILGGNPSNLEDAKRTRDAGGLHVIGTERHEARRIDDQLRGRAGRQGDPGSSQFFVSTEDEVVRIFGGDRIKGWMERLGVGEDEVIENKLINRAIEQAQSKIEGHNFDTRKYVLEYDDVMNKHRTAIYELRNEALRTESLRDKLSEYVAAEFEMIKAAHAATELGDTDEQKLKEATVALLGDHETAEAAYVAREQEIGMDAMRDLEKTVLLRVIDELWVDHLEEMEHLRDSVRLRAYGQRDPLVEYKIEAQRLFNQLQATIQSQVANLIFKVNMVQQPRSQQTVEGRQAVQPSAIEHESHDHHTPGVTVHDSQPKIGRNDPCPCGSGKKFKKCGLINAPYHKQ
ncbi:MAG: preprotein translocase subunit SecA [Patescibacteria group bacterium]